MEKMYYRIGLEVDLVNFIFNQVSIMRDKNIQVAKKTNVRNSNNDNINNNKA
jgi:hypothetical protein